MGHGELWRVEAVEEWCVEVSFGKARRGGLRRLGSVLFRLGSLSYVWARHGKLRLGGSGLVR